MARDIRLTPYDEQIIEPFEEDANGPEYMAYGSSAPTVSFNSTSVGIGRLRRCIELPDYCSRGKGTPCRGSARPGQRREQGLFRQNRPDYRQNAPDPRPIGTVMVKAAAGRALLLRVF